MKRLLCTALGATLLATSAMPARAGDLNLNKSETSVLVSTVSVLLVLSSPAFLVAAGMKKADDLSEGSREHSAERKAKRISAGPVPDMTVTAITTTDEGNRRVDLADPQNAENTATLLWSLREDDPAMHFSVGQRVAFTPSPKGSGWMLRADDGAVLAFVPTAQSAADNHSTTL